MKYAVFRYTRNVTMAGTCKKLCGKEINFLGSGKGLKTEGALFLRYIVDFCKNKITCYKNGQILSPAFSPAVQRAVWPHVGLRTC